MQKLAGLSEVADRFDAFLVDQFGVLHDGTHAYPGVPQAVAALKAAGKAIVILTNSGKPASANLARFARLGFDPSLFDAVVSSGDVARAAIADGSLGAGFRRGAAVFVVGEGSDDYGLDGLDLTPAARPEAAGFILIAGSDAPRTSLDDYAALFRPAAARGVPALCINPDEHRLTPQGLQPAAGAIAALYGRLGGPVTFVGKPHGAIYAAALRRLEGTPAGRILVVGDSIDHDVRGGRDAGLATLLVRTGVLAALDTEALEAYCARRGGLVPDYVLHRFAW